MRVYQGRRIGNEGFVMVRLTSETCPRNPLPASPRPGRLYAGGHEWGYGGSGPHQLSYDLLYHATANLALAAQFYRLFACDVVSRLPRDGWELSRAQIVAWVASVSVAPAK